VSDALPLDVDAILADPGVRIVVCCGSGGVGKIASPIAEPAERGVQRRDKPDMSASNWPPSTFWTALEKTPERRAHEVELPVTGSAGARSRRACAVEKAGQSLRCVEKVEADRDGGVSTTMMSTQSLDGAGRVSPCHLLLRAGERRAHRLIERIAEDRRPRRIGW